MYRIEVFFSLVIAIIVILIFTQTISARVQYKDNLTVTLEYFPLRLILYNFSKRKKKIKLKRQIKRLRFFLIPILKTTRFLLMRSDTKVFSLDIPSVKIEEPHLIFLLGQIKMLGAFYVMSSLFTMSKNFYAFSPLQSTENGTTFPIDFEFSTRLYNIPLAFCILIFFSIKNIGRNKKIVR